MVYLLALLLMITPTEGLADHAQRHANAMANAQDLYHSDISPLLQWCSWAGENVGMGPNEELIDQALANSPSHAANIAHPRDIWVRRTARAGDGTLYLVDLYCVINTPAPAPPPPPPPPVPGTPRAPVAPTPRAPVLPPPPVVELVIPRAVPTGLAGPLEIAPGLWLE